MNSLALAQKEIFDALKVAELEMAKLESARADLRTQFVAQDHELSTTGKKWAEKAKALREQLEEMIAVGEREPVTLMFDKVKRTICWAGGGKIRLGQKAFKFVRLLYHAKNKRATSSHIAKCVWGDATEPQHNINVLFYRLEKDLAKANFPYEIKNRTLTEPVRELHDLPTNKIRKVHLRNAVCAFILKSKKHM
jgi:hypothetical protein